MLSLLMGVMAAGMMSDQPSVKTFTITVGGAGTKIAASRGYQAPPSGFGAINSTDFDGIPVRTIAMTWITSADITSFTVNLVGNLSARQLLITPQNYGSTLGPITGTFSGDDTAYTIQLPNRNLYDNWALDTTRTCTLELLL